MEFIFKVFNTLFFEEAGILFPTTFFFTYFFLNLKYKKKSFLNYIFIFIPILFIFISYSALPEYLTSLGQDSIFEVNSDLNEAIFYLKTLFIYIFDYEIFLRNRFWLVFLASVTISIFLFYLLEFIRKNKKFKIKNYLKFANYTFVLSFFIIIINIIYIFQINYKSGAQLEKIQSKLQESFSKELRTLGINEKSPKKALDLIVYVGESTSALHWSLYGYPFSTTPWLDSQKNKKNFIPFSRMYSRYTHTTPSLIDSLSICLEQKNTCSPFDYNNFKMLPIVEILKKSSIYTYLFSSQGSLGGHNFANKIVLNTDEKYYSASKSKLYLGNRSSSKIKDKEFFENNFCKNEGIFKKNLSKLIFLHSYAGHFGYNGYKFHIPKEIEFDYPDYINKKNFLGKDYKNFEIVKEYDTAMKYIDHTLEKVINCSFENSHKNNKPLIFIYFSDHGESPSSLRGHDSSRLNYEMLHVPFFIYFNEIALKKFRTEFEFLSSIKDKNLTLKSLSEIVLYLFDLNILEKDKETKVFDAQVLNSLNNDLLGIRKKLYGESKIFRTLWNELDEDKTLSLESFFVEKNLNFQDTSLTLWQLNNYLNANNLTNKEKMVNLVCQHRTNSFILQYKNSLSNGCFETDVIFTSNNFAFSTHEMQSNTNLKLENFLKSNYKKTTVWLDAKNLSNSENCNYALRWFEINASSFKNILLELPTSSIINFRNNLEWKNCLKKIKQIKNIELAYYLDNNIIENCSIIARENNLHLFKVECKEYFIKVRNFLEDINVNSITFDYEKGKEAVLNSNVLESFKWHVWHVDNILDFQELVSRNNVGIILIKNDKFLNNLN